MRLIAGKHGIMAKCGELSQITNIFLQVQRNEGEIFPVLLSWAGF